MKVLVTGANGMLGQDLCPILEDEDFDVIETDIHNLDITNLEQVVAVLNENAPDYVVHCAAYTNVDNAPNNISKVYQINMLGPLNLTICAKYHNAKVIHISTDFVFDGLKNK